MNQTGRRVENWSIEKLERERANISFPEYQRQPNLWSETKKSLLINSILIGFDIPKLYFNRVGENEYEVIDGQQRLWAIWGFINNEYTYKQTRVDPSRPKTREFKSFSQLSKAEKKQLLGYELQVTVFEDASDDYLRELFLRLQLGLLLVTGEKLNAQTGRMKEFVFSQLPKNEFMKGIKISARRYALENLGAQIVINAFSKHKMDSFARTRYEDLQHFFQEYKNPKGDALTFFSTQTQRIEDTLNFLSQCLRDRINELNGRSYVLSIYLFTDEVRETVSPTSKKDREELADFILTLRKRLKEDAKKGVDRTNREIYELQTMLSSSAGEKYQIARRHNKLFLLYDFYKVKGEIKGGS